VKKIILNSLYIAAVFAVALSGCKPDEPPVDEPKLYQPSAYNLDLPGGWPQPNFLPDNPLTVEGVALGRKLFYDPILSGNQTQACASCHNQDYLFTDDQKQFSIGSEGDIGTRNSMPLFNMNWSLGYFWNGREASLESLAQRPIEAHFEMDLDLDIAVQRLKDHDTYPGEFNKAFPKNGVTEKTLRYAIAQFVRSLLSYSSKWDAYFYANPQNPKLLMTDAQARGFDIFMAEEKGDCFHCHQPNSPFFVDLRENQFVNNGLDAQPDSGYMVRTGNSNDLGKFKTPSLRNIELTAPYMHDGRFATLRDVLGHYDTGFVYSPTISPLMLKHVDQNQQPIKRLTDQDKDDLIEFLKLLTDTTFVDREEYSNPF